jgi:hypothetical protein
MKLRNLFESAARIAFLEFQQRLVELDDGFEQADQVMVERGMSTDFYFVRPIFTKKHNIRTIILTRFENNQHVDYRIAAYGCTPVGKSIGRTIFTKVCFSIDEAIIYLDRVINAKA